MRESFYFLLAAVGMGLVTLICRGSFLVLPPRFELPPRIEAALRYAPACALTAIIVPAVATDASGDPLAPWSNPRLWGAAVASAVFVKWRSMQLTMVVGMAAFTVMRLILQ
jgi:branched-subunit amino acid transport protein